MVVTHICDLECDVLSSTCHMYIGSQKFDHFTALHANTDFKHCFCAEFKSFLLNSDVMFGLSYVTIDRIVTE